MQALGAGSEERGFPLTIALFAIALVLLFWRTFVTTRGRVSPPTQQQHNLKGELRELMTNRPWVISLLAAGLRPALGALRSGSTVF